MQVLSPFFFVRPQVGTLIPRTAAGTARTVDSAVIERHAG